MPSDPHTLQYRSGVQAHAYMFGSEYDHTIVGTHDHNVPCAVCLTKECPTSWTMEYKGYLMTEYYGHWRPTYECVDYNQEYFPGSHSNVDEALLYHVEAECGGMQCPPYYAQKELTCVMCTL